ncbi:MAG: metalloregulator ArsR/SmtB family transcription factor [Phycisphaerae bacterium]|nr:metalloregulator ArsR/SmtB family transcription factor [Phycisphaerae bacterium]
MDEFNAKWILMCKILKHLVCSDRLGIFALLSDDNTNIEQLSQQSGMSKSTICRHLRALHNSGLVRRTKQGQQVLYRLDKFSCNLAADLKRMTHCILTKQLGSN